MMLVIQQMSLVGSIAAERASEIDGCLVGGRSGEFLVGAERERDELFG